MTILILVRHGQTEWNRNERFRGRVDIPLNQTGISQAQAVAERIAASWQPQAVVASPLERTTKTASFIVSALDILLNTDHNLIDIDYGQWQGLTAEEAHANWPQLVDEWFSDPTRVACPGGESLAQVRRRAFNAVKTICARHPQSTVVAVSHLVVIRLMLLSVLGLPSNRFWDIGQEPCAINLIEHSQQRYKLVMLNDTCHLR